MPKSLALRLNGNKQQFLDDVKRYGQLNAMDMWSDKLGGYHDIIGLANFLEKETGDPDYGIRPTLGSLTEPDFFENFLATVHAALSKKEARIVELEKQIRVLKNEQEYQKAQRINRVAPQISQIMDLCKEG